MKQRIAVIPGDGIGKEVMPEGLRALDAAARRHGLEFTYEHHDFASCDYYLRHGAMLPDDWKGRLAGRRRDFLRRRRLAGDRARSRFAVGIAAQVPP